MLLTITTTHRPATDLGYLLSKHPDRVQRFEQSFGAAYVFYPEANDERTTVALLVPLAVTSTKAMIRRLGKRWAVLHRAIYVIAVLGVIHFWMSVKKDVTDPLIFAVIFGVLLAYRLLPSVARDLRLVKRSSTVIDGGPSSLRSSG